MKIIISAPSYDVEWGGIIVLHRLCHILNEIGFESYMVNYNGNLSPINLNSEYNTKNINWTDVDKENDIIVYPEITNGNPYGFKKCVRYVLFYNKVRKTYPTWGKNDFWLYYTESFYDGMQEKNILNVFDTKVDFYKDLNQPREDKSCYSNRKIADYDHVSRQYHDKDSVFIGGGTFNQNGYLQIFNRYKRYYSYDNDTYTTIISALCGCETIVVPVKGVTSDDFKKKHPLQRYGVSYGLEDIDNFKNVDKLRDTLLNKEKTQYEETKKMFDKIINYFNNG